jgi:trans-2,3-dihydro-3-hydroxyanthranilate isomerase
MISGSETIMKLDFHTLDVFTNRRFSGNPLAVVLDADQLSAEQMQTITREFNLSETTFVMKPDDAANTAKVRIFFPRGEMPFAGHPTIGTAILLAELKHKPGCAFETTLRLELKAGLTPVKVTRIAEHATARLVAPKLPALSLGDVPGREDVARALDIAPEDIGFGGHALALTRGAIGFLTVPVKSRQVLAQARIIEPHWSGILKSVADLDAAYVYARGGDNPATHFRARMFSPTGGIPEDPATGSATVQMAAQLLAAEKLKDGSHAWRFEQGYEMGRPSDLHLEADVAGGKIAAVRLAGQAVQVMAGVLET